MNWFTALALSLGPYLIFFFITLSIVFLLLRWLGAWLFRINDLIQLQKEILLELKKINSQNK